MAEANWVDTVHAFWFEELEPKQWFVKSDATDAVIRERFLAVHETVAGMALDALTVDGRTATSAVIALDQFPRNMFRGSPRSFATDPKALQVARAVVGAGLDQGLTKDERLFAYLPFEHSEDPADQDQCVSLISALDDAELTRYAEAHRDVIRTYGRFPHRNAILGRDSTPEEEAYLAKPGSGF